VIKATNATIIAAPEHSSVREARHDDERAPERFAAVMAGAMHTHAPKHAHVKPKDGTSELDAPEQPADKDATGATTTDSKEAAASDATAKTDAADKTAATDKLAKTDATASANDVVRSLAALDPALQAKLARVMARMREETGQDVKVTETYRSQERQDTLYAQGRQASGPVVTWTQNSKHTQGRAVDVLLGAGSAGPDAYAILQRIANEEGLRTLGANDPGHLELPSTGATSAAKGATPTIPAAPADASGPGMVSVARLAQVAQIATVTVAQPAQVAHIATVGQANPGSRGLKIGQPNISTGSQGASLGQTPAATLAQANLAAQSSKDANGDSSAKIVTGAQANAGTQTGPKVAPVATQGTPSQYAGSQAGGRQSGASSGERGTENGASDRNGYGALDAAFSMRGQPSAPFSLHGVTAANGTTAAERAERIMAAIDNAPVRPLSQITMNVDAGNGNTDRIQVGLRGSSLNATIDTVDIGGAHAMNARSDELVRALSRDGVEVESLRVRATSTATPLAPQASRGSSDASNGARSERGNQWQQQDKQQSENDRRQQQRDKRGGNTQ
jgi:uncharacterized protein YcbK (DUF882 family)